MDKNTEMAHPFRPGETPGQSTPETPVRRVEHAYNPADRALAQRRRLGNFGKVAVASVLAVAGAVGLGKVSDGLPQPQSMESFDAKIEQAAKDQLVKPDAFNSGLYRIIITDSLNVRNAPYIEDNSIDWDKIVEIGGKNIQGAISFDVDKPYIKTGQSFTDSSQNGQWLELDAKVSSGSQVIDQEVFISYSPETIASGFVEAIKSGTTMPLSRATENDNLGVVTVNRNP